MDDILDFGCDMLVDNGRLCMWMPTANDDETEIAIPTHPALKLVSVSVQQFNKCRHLVEQRTSQFADTWIGARRLLTYQRIAEKEINQDAMRSRQRRDEAQGTTADELNKFRRKVSCSEPRLNNTYSGIVLWRLQGAASRARPNQEERVLDITEHMDSIDVQRQTRML